MKASKVGAAVAAICTVGLLLGGCGRGKASTASSQPQPSAVSSASPSASVRTKAEADAVAAYSSMMRSWVEAAKTSDAQSAALRQYAEGEALKTVVTVLYSNNVAGKVVLGELASSPKAVAVDSAETPAKVTINDCLDDTKWLEHKKAGGLWDDKPGGRRAMTAFVARTDAGWKVVEFGAKAYGSC